MQFSITKSILHNFLGNTHLWYKVTLLCFLLLNPIIFFLSNAYICAWLLILEFIFVLSMSLQCYPLLSGGLLVIESVVIGIIKTENIKQQLDSNQEIILLLIFTITSINFIKDFLIFIFTKIIFIFNSKSFLGVYFCLISAILSAFLDALTVIAIVITVGEKLYSIYHEFSIKSNANINCIKEKKKLEDFYVFLRSLMMQSIAGTAIGGVMTMIGEPQNFIIAKFLNWNFFQFFLKMTPITIPVFIFGMIISVFIEHFKCFGYNSSLPKNIKDDFLKEYNIKIKNKYAIYKNKLKLYIQGLAGLWLIIGLSFHLSEAGLIGLSVIIFTAALCGVTDEHVIGYSFSKSLPFTSLMIVFFSIITVVLDQKLFDPVILYILTNKNNCQLILFYISNGLFSAISDNVFVGSIYINEIKCAYEKKIIDLQQFELLAIITNIGTNIPSIFTPNGQAAFLFLLTSPFAKLIKFSYLRMCIMALPFAMILSVVSLLGIIFI